jgi:hypothetical protein
MTDPSFDLEEWAASYRRARRPSPTRRRAIRAAVRTGAATQDRWIHRQRWLGVSVALAACVLGVLALGRLLVGRAERVVEDDARSLAPHSAPQHEGGRAVEGTSRAGVGGPAPSEPDAEGPVAIPDGVDTPAAATASTPDSRGTSKRRRTEPEPEPASEPSTPEELESMRLLREAERRLETDAAASLRLLERHEQRFPGSSLALEREALVVIALCRVGRTDVGRERQRAFLESHGRSAYAARVRSACEASPPPSP